jgi:hypothetical protein
MLMRHRLLLCLIALTCAIVTAPSMAQADLRTPLLPPCTVAGTLTLSPPPPFSNVASSASAGFTIPLHAGETFTATLTTGPGVDCTHFGVTTHFCDWWIVDASRSGSVRVLRFAGETSQTALLDVSASSAGTFTLDVGQSAPLQVGIGPMRGPSRAKRKRAFWVDTKLSDYNGFITPVRFMIDRKVHGRWRGYSSILGNGDSPGESWHYYAKLRLPRGTFRVRARFRDAAHPTALYNRWKTITVR